MNSAPRETRRRHAAQALAGVVDLQRRIQTPAVAPFHGHQLSRSHLGLLFVLSHHGRCTPSELAAQLRITPGAVTQLVTRLRDAGLVESTRHPDDSRSVIVALTDSARLDIDEFETRILDAALPVFASLTDPELATLAALLNRVGAPHE